MVSIFAFKLYLNPEKMQDKETTWCWG